MPIRKEIEGQVDDPDKEYVVIHTMDKPKQEPYVHHHMPGHSNFPFYSFNSPDDLIGQTFVLHDDGTFEIRMR